jgi:diguanylate cyclase (GGDEF)-like protein
MIIRRRTRVETERTQLQVFHEVARALTSTLNLDSILGVILSKMAEHYGPERWSLLLVDEKRQELYYQHAVGQQAGGVLTGDLSTMRVPMGSGIAGWVAETGNSLVVPDVARDEQWADFARNNPNIDLQSIVCVPIRLAQKTLGVIQLLNVGMELMSEESLSFLRLLCDYAAIAIQNARSMQRIEELSITDDCTGLFNARYLYTRLDEEIARVQAGGCFSLIFIDLDRFKQVNDTYGHLIGSALLEEVGDLLRRGAGPNSAAFRYGGDEFVLMLPSRDKDAATNTTLHIWESLRTTEFLTRRGLHLHLSGSFGMATFPEDGADMHSIIRAADAMMYEAKNRSRDTVYVAGRGMLLETEQETVLASGR